mmetsp:Transcript_57159/g.135930  ORF Transcript_57159/g.135930 Transcript_57159/m.135930 type:complete len:203 (+) Transcript_57159:50-658(+)
MKSQGQRPVPIPADKHCPKTSGATKSIWSAIVGVRQCWQQSALCRTLQLTSPSYVLQRVSGWPSWPSRQGCCRSSPVTSHSLQEPLMRFCSCSTEKMPMLRIHLLEIAQLHCSLLPRQTAGQHYQRKLRLLMGSSLAATSSGSLEEPHLCMPCCPVHIVISRQTYRMRPSMPSRCLLRLRWQWSSRSACCCEGGSRRRASLS